MDTDLPQNTWEAQALGHLGMTVAEVMDTTKRAYADGAGMNDVGGTTVTSIGPAPYAAARPFLYPEMVDLYGCLISNGIAVYVASASNVWTVRWMAANVLNPALAAEFGPGVQLAPQNVMGVAELLRDTQTGALISDSELIRARTPEGLAYAAGELGALQRYVVTPISGATPTDDFGKPANVLEWVSKDPPLLVGGDSNGDFANFARAENRLFVARLTVPTLEQQTITQYQNEGPGPWIVQPTLFNENPGFISSQQNLVSRLPQLPAAAAPEIAQSITSLSQAGMLNGFTPPS